MRSAALGIITTTLVLMALPIFAFVDNPERALRGAIWFYSLFLLFPLAVGFGLLIFDRRRRRRNSPDGNSSGKNNH